MEFNRRTLEEVDKLFKPMLEGKYSTLWRSQNGKWRVFLIVNCNYLDFYDVEHHSRFNIGVSNETNSDWPIKYSTGEIGYDDPGWVPKYVRDQIEKIGRELSDFRGNVFHNPDFDKVLAMLKD